jgi:hypothetical protein
LIVATAALGQRVTGLNEARFFAPKFSRVALIVGNGKYPDADQTWFDKKAGLSGVDQAQGGAHHTR